MNTTTKSIVTLFKEAAEDHALVEWFDYGTTEFLFSSHKKLEYPAVFLQILPGTISFPLREERTFILYSIQKQPDRWEYDKDDPFDFNEQRADARDAALQIVRDIMSKVEIENRAEMIIEPGELTDDGLDAQVVGWRHQFTIVTDAYYDISNDFPE